jgi:hypothetical protein
MKQMSSPLQESKGGGSDRNFRQTDSSAIRQFDSRESLTALWKGVASNVDTSSEMKAP